MKMILALFGLVALSSSGRRPETPDEESMVFPFIVSVEYGSEKTIPGSTSFYFKMTPDPADRYDRDKGMGYAYHIRLVLVSGLSQS